MISYLNIDTMGDNDQEQIILPPEVVAIIANHNQIAFAKVCKWYNKRYRLNIALDYLRCINIVFRRCGNCDMIFTMFNSTPNESHSKMNDVMQLAVNMLWREVTYHSTITSYCRRNFTKDPNCSHLAHISIYGFTPLLIPILYARARVGDRGLLDYMQMCLQYRPYNLVESIYNDMVSTKSNDTDYEFMIRMSNGRYWESLSCSSMLNT